MRFIYTLCIRAYGLIIWLSQPFSHKARQWIRGRKNQSLEKLATLDKPIWIHCPSLGEFEQGRPLVEAINRSHPGIPIVISFFSPSGYEVRKDYPLADAVIYLPLDLPRKAAHFVDVLRPRLAIFVKYDFWLHTLNALQRSGVPYFFISLILRDNHFLFYSGLQPIREAVFSANQLFCQDERTRRLLENQGVQHAIVAGDTRVDRVLELVTEKRTYSWLQEASNHYRVFVFGSIWSSDLQVLLPWLKEHLDDNYFFVLAPHDVSEKTLQGLENALPGMMRTSSFHGAPKGKLAIVDTIGDLAYLYQYAYLAYVGGGFGRGIHSILEPAAHGIPILFGPNHQKFAEASHLIDLGAAMAVHNTADFAQKLRYFSDPQNHQQAEIALKKFFAAHRGATSKILHYLRQSELLSTHV